MKNIHLFETKNAYDAAKSGLILPRVSYIKENQIVDYNPHHDFVEIAGIKWATMNVGAKSITDYGLYFQWGDTSGYTSGQVGTSKEQEAFSKSDYNEKIRKKNNNVNGKYNQLDRKTVLELKDDAVNAAWGGSWRMPTVGDFQKLCDAVNTEWKTNYQGSDVNGLLCTDKKDKAKTLFFPACGYASNGSIGYVGSRSYCWSSSLKYDSDYTAYCLFGNDDNEVYWWQDHSRYFGFAVRGVLDEK